MNENTVKIRLKIGDLEVEYEGCSSFLRDDLSPFLKNTIHSYAEQSSSLSPSLSQTPETPTDSAQRTVEVNLSTATIAARMSAKSGSQLAIAAAARLTFVEKKEEFSRRDLLSTMKEAKSYYKSSMGSNLSKILKGLVNQQSLNETASNTFALTSNQRENMEKLLA